LGAAVRLAALDRPTPEERAAFVEETCAGQPELRRRVCKLLAAGNAEIKAEKRQTDEALRREKRAN
jgi:hypothetical protein